MAFIEDLFYTSMKLWLNCKSFLVRLNRSRLHCFSTQTLSLKLIDCSVQGIEFVYYSKTFFPVFQGT